MNNNELKSVLQSKHTALLVIDMQGDYCEPGYYMEQAGYDIERLRRPIPFIKKVLIAARSNNLPIIFTRQYRVADATKTLDARDTLPQTSLKGDEGWEIIPELKPNADEIVLDKTTSSVFASTDIDELLKQKGISTLVFCGNTIDVCVHSSLRSADDLGYKCITIADCCGAVNDHLYDWSLESIQIEGGVFGKVINSEDFINAL